VAGILLGILTHFAPLQALVKFFTKFLPHLQTHCFIVAASLEVRLRSRPCVVDFYPRRATGSGFRRCLIRK
jgi:hypothetical protein